jgi:formylglycine-generating enzyme required for sulfatase activity
MTEATGKGNCMLARKNTLKHSIGLILFGAMLCASYTQAQQQAEDTDRAAQSGKPSESRRIERLGEGSTDEWEMDLALPSAASPVSTEHADIALPDSDQDQKLHQLLSKLATNPGDANVLAQLNALLADVLVQANGMMDASDFQTAGQLLQLLQSIEPGLAGLDAAKNRLQSSSEVSELLKAGDASLESRRILEPEKDNALYYFKQALSKDPNSQPAHSGLAAVQEALVELALESARELDFEMADEWLLEASAVRDEQKPVEDTRLEVGAFKQTYAAELEQKAIKAMDSGDFSLADISVIDLIALGGQEERVDALRTRLKEARLYGGFGPGQIISDELLHSGGKAPEIVIIPAGSFLMGSRRSEHEKPRHRVTLEKGFGLGTREVTVAEFRQFIERNAYRTTAELKGSSSTYNEAAGRLNIRDGVNWKHDYRGKKASPDMPVLHVSLYDATAYVQWLARETGRAYRLPSEAEYEYVARASGKGSYWWGEGSPSKAVENLTGEGDSSPSKREWTTSFKKYDDGHWGPAPAGALSDDDLVHPMGVHDIAGNVSEWTEDCWHENYVQAPVDGSAWFNPGCERRVVRGGYWASAPEQSRASVRIPVKADKYGPVIGFRIARDL